MLRLAFGGNFDAPVEKELQNGITVLDSACGKIGLNDLYKMKDTKREGTK